MNEFLRALFCWSLEILLETSTDRAMANDGTYFWWKMNIEHKRRKSIFFRNAQRNILLRDFVKAIWMRNWPIHLRWPSNGQVSVLSCSHKSDQFAHCQKDGSVCGLGRNSEPRTWDREQATVDISSFCATMRLAAPYSSARHLIPSSRVHPIPGS